MKQKLAALRLELQHRVGHRFKRTIIYYLLCLPISSLGQTNCFSKSEIKNELVIPYMSFFDQIELINNASSGLNVGVFKSLFANKVIIDNDLITDQSDLEDDEKFKTWQEYVARLENFRRSPDINIRSIDFETSSTKYAQQGNIIFVWLYKIVRIEEASSAIKEFKNVIKLTVSKNLGHLQISKIEIVTALPLDDDNDQIPNSYDNCPKYASKDGNMYGCIDNDTDCDGIPNKEDKCPNVAGVKSARGCPDADGDGVSDFNDQCINIRGPKSNYGCPNPPMSRIDFETSAIGAMALDNEFGGKNIANGTNLNPGVGFAKYAYGASLALDLNFSKNVGLAMGYEYLNFFMDNTALANDLKTYLRNNGYAINSLSVTQSGYKFHGPFGGLFGGNFNGKKISFKITPLIAYLMPVNGNKITLNVNYASSPQQLNSFDLTPSSFTNLGGAVTMMFKLNKSSTRVHLSTAYMEGTIPFTTEKTKFQNLPSQLEFPAMRFKIVSLSLGVHVRLSTPKHYKD